MALSYFQDCMAGSSINDLTPTPWTVGKTGQSLQLLLGDVFQPSNPYSPCFIEWFQVIRQEGQQLERCWRKSHDESSWPRASTHFRAHAVVVIEPPPQKKSSLLGTNLRDILEEASRVLRSRGTLLITEVASRFLDAQAFVGVLTRLGFRLVSKDESSSHFFLFRLRKAGPPTARKEELLPGLGLQPCSTSTADSGQMGRAVAALWFQ